MATIVQTSHKFCEMYSIICTRFWLTTTAAGGAIRKCGALQANGGELHFNPQQIYRKFLNYTPVGARKIALFVGGK